MMKQSIILKLAVIFLVVLFATIPAASLFAAERYQRVVILGDSLSDTGNLASVLGPFPSPPFYNNRVSNGPVAVEVLAGHLGLNAEASLHLTGPATGDNYAVAGATAGGSGAIDLQGQLLAYMANNGFIASPDTLFVIMTGGNDVRFARDSADRDASRPIIKMAVNTVGMVVKELVNAGARSFMVVNAPDIGNLPESRLLALATSDRKLKKRATRLSKYYRKQLKRVVEQLEEETTANITLFDLFKSFNRLIKTANKYGFTNSTDACFSSDTFEFSLGCGFGANFDQYVFFDEVHPTAKVHMIIGNAFYQALEKSNEHDDEEHEDEHEQED